MSNVRYIVVSDMGDNCLLAPIYHVGEPSFIVDFDKEYYTGGFNAVLAEAITHKTMDEAITERDRLRLLLVGNPNLVDSDLKIMEVSTKDIFQARLK